MLQSYIACHLIFSVDLVFLSTWKSIICHLMGMQIHVMEVQVVESVSTKKIILYRQSVASALSKSINPTRKNLKICISNEIIVHQINEITLIKRFL